MWIPFKIPLQWLITCWSPFVFFWNLRCHAVQRDKLQTHLWVWFSEHWLVLMSAGWRIAMTLQITHYWFSSALSLCKFETFFFLKPTHTCLPLVLFSAAVFKSHDLWPSTGGVEDNCKCGIAPHFAWDVHAQICVTLSPRSTRPIYLIWGRGGGTKDPSLTMGTPVNIQHVFVSNFEISDSGNMLRWPYCLTIIGCNFVSNDLLHQTLISYNRPWFTFPFMHIWWHHDDVIRF